jgi:hypothetical protein
MHKQIKTQGSITRQPKSVSLEHDIQMMNQVSAWFTTSEDLTKAVNKFAEKHAYDYDPHDEEFTHVHTSLHAKFKALIEEKLHEYFDSQNIKLEQFNLAARRFMVNRK